jgi:predicted tellurium resistance membrane protein TerC
LLEALTRPDLWIALASLTALEIVLGIDNIVFIAVLTGRLPERERRLAYRMGLGGALVTRVALLLALSWVMGLTAELFTVLGHTISGRDLILLVGGVFLIAKSAHEIFDKVELRHLTEEQSAPRGWASGLVGIVAQIAILDIVFSLDSVITAVGMVDEIGVMVAAIVIAIMVMMIFAKSVGDFVNEHPSMKLLALSFLLLIGVLLTAEALDQQIDKGYIYFAMGFALLVELLNMRRYKKRLRLQAEQAPIH